MQKLSGTISGKNKKSCGIFHHESNKISFAFFWFFYNFLRNLQESAKTLYYFRFVFAAGAREVLDSYIYIPLLCVLALRNKWILAMWSSGTDQRRSGQNPARAGGGTGRGRRGGGLGVAMGRCGRLDRRKERPTTAVSGAPGRRPREPLLRRDRDQSGASGGGSGSCECWRKGWLAAGASRDAAWRRRPWRAAAEQGAEGERRTPPEKARGLGF
jgi:hypothetical protein